MDVVESALGNSALAVALALGPVVLLDGDLVAVDGGDPGDVAVAAGVGLGDAAGLGGAVDRDAGALGRVVPGVGVAPVGALVLVVELDAEALVDAPRDKGGALWLGG